MKLTVETLDNFVKSTVINIGKNNGYVECYLDSVMENTVLHLYVYNKQGDVVHDFTITTKQLRSKGGYTTPKFEPAEEHYEGETT